MHGVIPAGREHAGEVAASYGGAYVRPYHRHDQAVFAASAQHLFGDGFGEPVPRDQEAERAAAIPVLDLRPEHGELILAALARPVLALRYDDGAFAPKSRIARVVDDRDVDLLGFRAYATGDREPRNRLEDAAAKLLQAPAFAVRGLGGFHVSHKLNERLGAALFDALIGLRVTRPSYVKLTELDERTATRDLVNAAGLGLLEARGERRGRHYVAGEPLRQIQAELRAARKPLDDPYPTLIGEIRRALP